MAEVSTLDEYNYAVFEGTDDFLAFRTALPVCDCSALCCCNCAWNGNAFSDDVAFQPIMPGATMPGFCIIRVCHCCHCCTYEAFCCWPASCAIWACHCCH
ncbi:MAG: hypothetical protein C4289_14370 [Chloroflexota bacterium]